MLGAWRHVQDTTPPHDLVPLLLALAPVFSNVIESGPARWTSPVHIFPGIVRIYSLLVRFKKIISISVPLSQRPRTVDAARPNLETLELASTAIHSMPGCPEPPARVRGRSRVRCSDRTRAHNGPPAVSARSYGTQARPGTEYSTSVPFPWARGEFRQSPTWLVHSDNQALWPVEAGNDRAVVHPQVELVGHHRWRPDREIFKVLRLCGRGASCCVGCFCWRRAFWGRRWSY